MHHRYIIVGGGVAGASAIEGIRAHDPDGSILLVSRENHAPYRRPLLTKALAGEPTPDDDLAYFGDAFYLERSVQLLLRRDIVELIPEDKKLWDDRGTEYTYDKLLLATGARPRTLDVPGADHPELRYFRSLEDHLALDRRIEQVQHVLVIGEDHLAVQLADAARRRGCGVTMIVAHDYPMQAMLPRDMGALISDHMRDIGIELVTNDQITAVENHGSMIAVRMRSGNVIQSQTAVVSLGSEPNVELAEAAGLEIGNGIEVDEHSHTSTADIWAAGDVTEFPHLALGRTMRLEQWDHAIHHGRCAGANMAGANQTYAHLPLFQGTVFGATVDAIGDCDSTWETQAVWREPYRDGVLFYVHDDVVRGVLMWNLPGDPEWARRAVRMNQPTTYEEREAMVLEAAQG